MKQADNGLATIAFIVIMGGAVALAIANDITAPICKMAAEARPKDKFDFGCFEFWFNRYQGLVGNLITAAVAGVTLIWISKELVLSQRQASVTAAEALRRMVADNELDRSALETFGYLIGSLANLQARPAPDAIEREHVSGIFKAVANVRQEVINALKHVESVQVRQAVGEVHRLTGRIAKHAANIIVEADRVASLNDDILFGGPQHRLDTLYHEGRAGFSRMVSEASACRDAVNEALNLVRDRIRTTHKSINMFEAAAVANQPDA